MAIHWDEGLHPRPRREPARLVRSTWRSSPDSQPIGSHDHGRTSWFNDRRSTPPPRREQLDSRSKLLFDRDVLAWFWPFAREEPHGHPPFYALLGLTGDFLAPSWQELPRARLGPILLFSLTAGAIFSFLATRWGYWPAALAAGSWVLQPNLFGHGHYASYDAVLSSLWVLSIIAFIWAVDREPGPAGTPEPVGLPLATFGVILGLRRRNQADRLVPPPSLSGLVDLVPQPSGLPDAFLGVDHRGDRALCPPACLVERAGRRLDAVSGFQPEPR